MLEILIMAQLLKAIGRNVRAKGRTATGYQVLAVFLWVGGEITGFVIGFANDMGNASYVLALMGAATGALIAWLIAASVKPLYPTEAAVGRIFE